MVKIEIISKDFLKPSSSTPDHLRTYRLSLLDQLFPPLFVPLILYYSNDESTNVKQSDMYFRLKKSLPDALTLYYPLAGRLRGESSVDCNDEGVDYLEARVDCRLSDITESPQVEVVSQFAPSMNCKSEETNSGVLLVVQVSLFNCGGIAIGICLLHRIADGCTLSTFIKTWAAMVRGEPTGVVSPIFISSSLFPPKEPLGFKPRAEILKGRLVTRRFCFSGTQISALKAQVLATAGTCAVPPTRVELVTAAIWKWAMTHKNHSSVVFHSVNMRGRMDPPLPECTFGNLIRTAYASTDGGEMELGSLVGKVREGIGEIDSEHLKKLQGENGYEMIMGNNVKMKGVSNKEVDFFVFTSWCRFPIYEADFGWGKPIWVSSAEWVTKNTVFLMDSMCDDGIEAWTTMEEEDMMRFEQQPPIS